MYRLLVVLLAGFVVGSSVASANTCLENSTNLEIINELRYRLDTGTGGGQGSVSATFLCGSNATLSVNAVNLNTGETSGYKMSTGDWTTCRNTADLLTTKVGNKSLNGGVIFAVCVSNATLKKVLISPTVGVKEVESTSTGDWTTCRNTADKINAAL